MIALLGTVAFRYGSYSDFGSPVTGMIFHLCPAYSDLASETLLQLSESSLGVHSLPDGTYVPR